MLANLSKLLMAPPSLCKLSSVNRLPCICPTSIGREQAHKHAGQGSVAGNLPDGIELAVLDIQTAHLQGRQLWHCCKETAQVALISIHQPCTCLPSELHHLRKPLTMKKMRNLFILMILISISSWLFGCEQQGD